MNKNGFLRTSAAVLIVIVSAGILLYGASVFALIDSLELNGPESGINTTDNTPDFNFTVFGNSTTYDCTLYINNTPRGSDAAVNNNTPKIITANSTLTDGLYVWHVNCTDSDAIVNTTSERTITIDATPPAITAYSPLNNSYYNTVEDILINMSATDLGFGVDTLWYFNETDNVTFTESIYVNVTEGVHNYIFYANDTLGNLATKPIVFTTDITDPTITINSPASDSVKNSKTLSINISASDTNLNYTLIQVINSSENIVNSTTNIGSEFVVSLSVPSDGAYNITATVYDKAARTAADTKTDIIIDSTAPNVNYDEPASLASGNHSLDYINTYITASDDGQGLDTITIRLYNETTLLYANTSTSSPFYINYTNLANGLYYLNASANDTVGNIAHTTKKTIYLDTIAPTAGVTTGVNSTYVYGTWLACSREDINITASFNDSSSGINASSCQWKDRSGNGEGQWHSNNASWIGTSTSGYCVAITGTSTAEQDYNLNLRMRDNAGNLATATIFPGNTDCTNPSTTDNAPSSWQSSDVTVTLSPSDGGSGVASTKYSVNGGGEQTGVSVSISAEGNNTLTYYSIDHVDNTESTHTKYVLLDKTKPAVSSVAPADNSYSTAASVTLNFTATDALSSTMNCSVYIDSVYNRSVSVNNGSGSTSITFAAGSYTWYVNCSDLAGNYNSTSARNIIVDLANPVVNINSPSANTPKNSKTFIIDVSITETNLNYSLIRILNSTGGVMNSTTNTSNDFIVSLNVVNDGIYSVNVTSYDMSGRSGSGSAGNITVDTTVPTITFQGQTDTTDSYVVRTWSFINASINEAAYNCSLNWSGSVSWMSGSGTMWWINKSGLTDGTYNYFVRCNDTLNNFNNSEIRNITIDTTPPSLGGVTILSYNANASLAKTGDRINVSVVFGESITAPTVFIAGHSATVSGSGASWTANYTMSGSDTEGTIDFNISYADSLGNSNYTNTTTDSSAIIFDRTNPSTTDTVPSTWQISH